MHLTAFQNALRIISQPQSTDTASQRLLAWAALKSSRQQTLNQPRLRHLQRAAQ